MAQEQPKADAEGSAARERSGLLRAAFSMAALTMLSRVLGLVREQVRAYYLGTGGASDAFGVAFMLPNLLRRLLAEGAMSAAFVPVFQEMREKEGEKRTWLFASRFLNLALLILLLVSSLGVIGSGILVALIAPGFTAQYPETRELAVVLTAMMFPYILFVGLAALLQGMLNSYKVFWVSALTPVLLNLAIIGFAVALGSRLEQPAYAFAIGVIVGGVLQLAFQVPYAFRLGFRWTLSFKIGPGIKKAFWLWVPTVFGAGIYQINVLVSQALASTLPEGAISSLQYSTRLLELTLGVYAISISTVILPTLSRQSARKDRGGMRDTMGLAVRLICFICLPAMMGLYLLRVPVVRLLFERGEFDATSLQLTTWALTFHLAGLVFIALARIYVQAFYSQQDTKTPVYVALGVMVVNVVACVVLRGPLGNGGIALANTLAALVQMGLLVWLLRRTLAGIWTGRTWSSIARSAAATAGMSAAVYAMARLLHLDDAHGAAVLAGEIGAAVAVGGVVFVALAWVLRSPELPEMLGMVMRRFRR